MSNIANYYDSIDNKYTEIGTAMEKFHYRSKGKFYISSMTPLLSGSKPYDTTLPAPSKSNILNKPSLPISSIITSNYIELGIPEYMTDIKRVPLQTDIIDKGAKVQISFTGGDINKAKVIGPYN